MVNKSIIAVSLAMLFPLQVFAAQLQLQTRANTTSPSVDTNFTRQQLMNTEVYTTKADKDKVVRYWEDFPDGGAAIAVGTPAWYGGKLYNTIQAFVKTAGETPDKQTDYFAEVTGSGGGITHATSDGGYYASKDGAWANIAGVFLTPTGSAASLTSFPSSLATDTEVTSAINALPSLAFGTGLTVATDTPSAGTDTISVTANTYQAYDADLTTWAGVTPGVGVATALAVNADTVGGLPITIAKGAYTVDTAPIAANTCASAVAVTATGVATTDVVIATPNSILSTIAGFGVTTAGAVRVDIYPTSGNVNFQFCNPTSAAIDPGSVTFNWKVLR